MQASSVDIPDGTIAASRVLCSAAGALVVLDEVDDLASGGMAVGVDGSVDGVAADAPLDDGGTVEDSSDGIDCCADGAGWVDGSAG